MWLMGNSQDYLPYSGLSGELVWLMGNSQDYLPYSGLSGELVCSLVQILGRSRVE